MTEYDLWNATLVAWGAYEARGGELHDSALAVAKSFKLTEDDALLLELAMIEFDLGMSSIGDGKPTKEPIGKSECLDLYELAVKAELGKVEWKGRKYQADLVRNVLRNALINGLL